MRKAFRWRVLGATLLALALIGAACADSNGAGGDVRKGPTITVSSANFAESQILAEIFAIALENDGFKIERKLNLGSREITTQALESGEVDLMPEYTGAMLTHLGGTASSDSDATFDALVDALQARGLTAFDFAPAEDKDGEVVTQKTADELGLEKTSDLAEYNGQLVFGGPPECPQRPFCLIGLQNVYGLQFKDFKALDVGGPLTVAALESDEIQVARLFTTDGTIAAKGFVLLEDDLNLHPAQNIVPVVNSEVADAYGNDLEKALQDITKELTTDELTELNRRAGIDQEDPADIARSWLEANGLI